MVGSFITFQNVARSALYFGSGCSQAMDLGPSFHPYSSKCVEDEFAEAFTILSLLSEEGASMGIPSRPGATLLWVS